MADPKEREADGAEAVLAALNADKIVTHPGELEEPQSPADDTDVPPPG